MTNVDDGKHKDGVAPRPVSRTEKEQKELLETVDVNILRNIAEACKITGYGGINSISKKKPTVVKSILFHVKNSTERWTMVKDLIASSICNSKAEGRPFSSADCSS